MGTRYFSGLVIVGVCVASVLLGWWVVVGPLAATFSKDPSIGGWLKLLLAIAGAGAGLMGVVWFFQRRAVPLALVMIVSLGLPLARIVRPLAVLYADDHGNLTYLTVYSVILVAAFVSSELQNRGDHASALSEPVVWMMGIIATAGLLTQSVHIGVAPAAGLVYVRVVEPVLFIVVVARAVYREGSLRSVVTSFVAAVVIGLLSRFAFDAAGVVQLTADVRAAAIGSRTIYGTILAATVMLIVGLALYSRSKWVSACWIALIPIAIVELLATQTRGAVGGLAAVTAFILVRDYRARSAVAAAVLGLTFLLSGVVWTTPDGRTLALNWSVIVSDPNWLIRVARNQQAVDYVLAHPFTGLGMGHASSSGDAAIAQWVYNPYLAWGVSFGIPALLAFAGLMVVTAIDSFSAVFRTLDRERFLRIGVLAALGAWVVNQFTTGDSLLYLQASEAVFFFWGVVGMVLGCKWVDTASRPPSSKTRGWRVSRDEKAPQERVGVA